jgi:hypothetical protein
MKYFELKGNKLRYSDCEQLANELIKFLEKEAVLVKVSINGWKLNYPMFVTGADHTFEINKTNKVI